MDPLNGTITCIGYVINGQAEARRRNPRLNALLEGVEELLETFSKPENNGSTSESDGVANRTRTCRTKAESEEQQQSETTADLKFKPDQELKSLPDLESQSEVDDPGSKSNPESELESSVHEPWGSAERKVFGIEWILEWVLGYLDDDPVTLFECRCVNKQWNKISTEILNSRQLARINIAYESYRFIIKRDNFPLPLPLERYSLISDFESACHSGGPFPWNYFSIQGGSLGIRQLQQFLSKHGRIIKQLDIELSERYGHIPDPLITDLRRLLVEQVPNIEVLTLSNFPKGWKDLRLFPESKEELVDVLKNLKKIYFASKPPKFVAIDLLKVSRRLRNINWQKDFNTSPAYYLELILNSNRLELLTRLQIEFPVLQTESNVFWKLIERQPLFSYIEVFESGRCGSGSAQEGVSMVSKLLESSSSTLKTLVISQLIFCEILPVPLLPNLKRLVLDMAANRSALVDENFSLAKYFPHMTDIAIRFKGSSPDPNYWKNVFQDLTKHSLTSVRTLELHWMPLKFELLLTSLSLDATFPKLKHLTLRNITDFANTAKVLWTLVRIQSLELEMIMDLQALTRGVKNRYPAIDAGFTGFSEETCCQLYESLDDIETSSLKELRENKSLLDMECLETLRLVLTGFGIESNKTEPMQIISHVSGLYAFRMCPKLKVKLQVYAYCEVEKHVKNLLSPIFPFVQNTVFKHPFTMPRFLNIQ